MTELLSALSTRHAAISNAVNFTLLLLTLMLAGYFGLTNYELELARAAV